MFFDLNNLDIKEKERNFFGRSILFSYHDEEYYYKSNKSIDSIYNELIAKKIADRLGIICCEYYQASYYESLGVVSKVFNKDNFHSISELLLDYYGKEKGKNNINSISILLDNRFPIDISERLKEELKTIFLFDALIGNCDRNTDNFGLIIDSNPRFAPLYDNENMLSDYGIYEGDYTLGIDEYDVKENLLYKLLDQDEYSRNKLKEMLPVISEESLEEIFTELESEYEINPYIKEKVLKKFSINRNMIERYYNQKVKRRIKGGINGQI